MPTKQMQKMYKTTGNVLELPPRISLIGGTTYNFSVQAIEKTKQVRILNSLFDVLTNFCLQSQLCYAKFQLLYFRVMKIQVNHRQAYPRP